MVRFINALSCVFVFSVVFISYSNSANTIESQTEKSQKSVCSPLPKLDVLPGLGVDIVRSKEMAPVFAFTYNECKTTLDKKFLIPDQTYVIPQRKSNVEIFSELLENFEDYKSLTGRTIEVEASYNGLFQLAGKYDDEYLSLKQKQVDHKTVTTRIAAKYTLYKIGIHLPIDLAPELKALFYSSLDALKQNNTEKSNLLLEFVLRDYGTHATATVDAGAMIAKEDFILRTYVDSFNEDKHVITAAASGSFFNIYNIGASYNHVSDASIATNYTKNTVSSKVKSFGGTFFKPNMSVDIWIDSIPDNLVSIDKSGVPLENVIRPDIFPDVPLEDLLLLQQKYSDARNRYISLNRHVGCMNYASPNFDYSANVQKTCEEPNNNYTFAGIYQTCNDAKISSPVGRVCSNSNVAQKNLVTGGFTCPPNYMAVFLKNGTVDVPYESNYESCSGWWIFQRCHTNYYTARGPVYYETYWCAAKTKNVTANNGVMFGGLFSSKIQNPLTNAQSCPPTYLEIKVLQDLHVCIGVDYEQGYKYSVKFGGFFSCQNGNPLLDVLKLSANSLLMLSNWQSDNNLKNVKKACPKGYTQHTAVSENDCFIFIMYCTEAGAFGPQGVVPIVLPPFRNISAIYSHGNLTQSPPPPSNSHSSTGTFFGGIGVGIAICIALVAIAILGYTIRGRRRYQRILEADIRTGETDRLLTEESRPDA